MHTLDLPINCDAALSAARDYFERVTREYHTKGPDGRDRSQVQLAVVCFRPCSATPQQLPAALCSSLCAQAHHVLKLPSSS